MFRIDVDHDRVADFCHRWHITEFLLFGSVLRDDFRPESDLDVLVVFAPDTVREWEDWQQMEEELEEMFGREVDLVETDAVRNPFRRHHILKTHRVVYAG